MAELYAEWCRILTDDELNRLIEELHRMLPLVANTPSDKAVVTRLAIATQEKNRRRTYQIFLN